MWIVEKFVALCVTSPYIRRKTSWSTLKKRSTPNSEAGWKKAGKTPVSLSSCFCQVFTTSLMVFEGRIDQLLTLLKQRIRGKRLASFILVPSFRKMWRMSVMNDEWNGGLPRCIVITLFIRDQVFSFSFLSKLLFSFRQVTSMLPAASSHFKKKSQSYSQPPKQINSGFFGQWGWFLNMSQLFCVRIACLLYERRENRERRSQARSGIWANTEPMSSLPRVRIVFEARPFSSHLSKNWIGSALFMDARFSVFR